MLALLSPRNGGGRRRSPSNLDYVMTLGRTTAGINTVENVEARTQAGSVLKAPFALAARLAGLSTSKGRHRNGRLGYMACTLEPTAARCARYPCRSRRFSKPPRRHRQGANKRIFKVIRPFGGRDGDRCRNEVPDPFSTELRTRDGGGESKAPADRGMVVSSSRPSWFGKARRFSAWGRGGHGSSRPAGSSRAR